MDRVISLEARRVDLSTELPFLLGRARVDPPAHEITIGRTAERMQPQTLKVLVALHDKSGQVVTRDELVDRCWDGRIVGEDVINRCILLLRRFAEESRGFRIETVPRAGYRLIEMPAPRSKHSIRVLSAASAAAVLALGVAALLLRDRDRRAPVQTPTIALLPFASDSAPDTRKLAASVREALANSLAQGEYDVSTFDTERQDNQAPADFVISGQVTGNAENIMAMVRMEETAHHIVVFAHRFEAKRDRTDTFPELIGAQVASQLSWTAPLIAIERRHPSDPAITASLLQASSAGLDSLGAMHDYETSRRLAVQDPNSPLAQTDFAFNTAFALDQIPREERAKAVASARVGADRALSLAPEFGDNYVPWCLLHPELQKIECEKRLREGMRADPNSPFANWFLAYLILNPVGRNIEALEFAGAALAHDPYMPNKIGLMLLVLEATGQTQQAAELYRRSVRWWPNDASIDWFRMTGIAERGDFDALKKFADQVGVEKSPNGALSAINQRSVPEIRRTCLTARDFGRIICMLALARSGDLNAAFALADQLYPSRRGQARSDEDRIWLDNPNPNGVAFLASPAAAALRRDPRYLPLADRVGLLEYWHSGRLPDFCSPPHPEPVCAQLRTGR